MKCYYVLVHGMLDWHVSPPEDVAQPRGFMCYRYVLAGDEQRAAEIAFKRVHQNLDRSDGWLSDGSASLSLEAEEIYPAPIHKLLKPDNRGHAFYDEQ